MEYAKKKKRAAVMSVCLLAVIIVLVSAVFVHRSNVFHSGESHFLEAIQGLHGKGVVQSSEDSENLERRRKLFSEGREVYPDMVAWLVLPGTMIDYPVMGGAESESYAERSYDGTADVYGTPYVDSGCGTDLESNFCTRIWGNDMNNNTMFGSLDNYRNASDFDAAKDGVLILPDAEYRLELAASFAVTETVTTLADAFVTSGDADAAEELLRYAAQKKEISVSDADRWLLLCNGTDETSTMLLLRAQDSR